nr:MAG TPA: hypothetical protein [Caudoviricetes sp.]
MCSVCNHIITIGKFILAKNTYFFLNIVIIDKYYLLR